MAGVIDPKTTWWWHREVQTRLSKWTLALLRGRPYQVQIDNQGTGYSDFANKIIQANAQLFPTLAVEPQFRLTQAILAHEVGHVLFTQGWKGNGSILKQLVNMLEDERIERCMRILYPGISVAFNVLGDRMLLQQGNLVDLNPGRQAVLCCLIWRWAHSRWGIESFPSRLMMSHKGHELWNLVRPLVEQAWDARSTDEVQVLAKKILDILHISPEEPPSFIKNNTAWSEDLPEGQLGMPDPLTPPSGPDSDSPGVGHLPTLNNFHEDNYSKPSPYIHIMEKVFPLAKALAQSLKRPEPETRLASHMWLGRYSFRQELRLPDFPNLYAQDIDLSSRSLALYLLTDRSGSMDSCNEQVREALMTLYLASTSLEIPTGLAFFGSDNYADVPSFVFAPTAISTKEEEQTLAMIAGFAGTTGAEFLAWGLERAYKEMMSRPERTRVIVVIHDGQPVYDGPLGVDRILSAEWVARMSLRGWIVIGVYLGGEDEDRRKLGEIFPRMISTSPSKLPDQLGRILRSLA
jgi:hypothetical protein